ncbi:unnamed protein product [Aspergillus oryzae]|uniref:Unnamed protein product n=2 Tax=Aspergillus oryzae TaxID=5062 RepID=A0AAN5C2E4_ASPOZ|nr:unnamed protein product [Aspergillus oryzae]GMF91719.1 unnamed protein product [Aspergillus oryzae]GMG04878.1 unnamed protein product [Aspergillus oryzae]GMG36440.1 unnamed protein product [Aspergillus oryzae]GMG51151.1 unnamed protein product [Aspergillus oryzae var. brunneus]
MQRIHATNRQGPSDGSSVGPNENIPIATPRCSFGITSAMVPTPIVNGAEPAHPARNLNARNITVPVDLAQPIVKPKNMRLHTWYGMRRP